MSVLRKRSPWFIPAASLLLGALTLGLAGCGGGDDDPFGNPDPGQGAGVQTFSVPSLPAVQAQVQQFIGAGQGGTLSLGNLNSAQHGGVTGVRVTVNPGSNLPAGTYGIALVPASQGTIQAVRNSGNSSAVQNIETIAEVVFGLVDANGNIIPESGGDALLDTVIDLTEAQSNAFGSALGGGNRRLQLIRVQNNVASSDPQCVPQFVRENRNVTVIKCRGGRAIVVHRPSQHVQGGGGS